MDEERGACRLSPVSRPLPALHPLMFPTRHIRAACTEAAKPPNVYPRLSLVVKTGMSSRDNWKEGRQLHIGLSCLFFPLPEALSLPFKEKEAGNVGRMGFMHLEIVEGVSGKEQKDGEVADYSDFTERLEGDDTQTWLRLEHVEIKRDGKVYKYYKQVKGEVAPSTGMCGSSDRPYIYLSCYYRLANANTMSSFRVLWKFDSKILAPRPDPGYVWA